jgi:cell division protein FtsQ
MDPGGRFMAAMRARRPTRGGGADNGNGRNKRSSQRNAPVRDPMPRLAAIKLEGIGPADVAVSKRGFATMAIGALLFTGAAIAGATWIGGSLFDAGQAFERSADSVAAGIGFRIDDIQVAGVSGARADEIRALVQPDGRHSLLAVDPETVKAQVESLDWIQDAKVRRLWPSTLQIDVERRQAFALWQEDGEIAVIDANGERLLAERAADHPNLLRVVGRGAGPAAEPLLMALEELPQVRERVRALVRVNDRRWNVELKSGATVELPEEGAVVALTHLESLQAEHRLLDRPVAQLDMRTPGRLAVRVLPPLAGGPVAAAGGA